jgi:hypothetical protein
MPLLGLTVGIDLNGFLDSESQLTRVRAEKRGSKAVGSGGGNYSTVNTTQRLMASWKSNFRVFIQISWVSR